MSNNIFSQSYIEFSKELGMSPAQLLDSLNKWSAINVKLQEHIEEMKQAHIAEMKAGFTTAEMVELDPQAYDAEPVEVYDGEEVEE
jgi:hypothetical protein